MRHFNMLSPFPGFILGSPGTCALCVHRLGLVHRSSLRAGCVWRVLCVSSISLYSIRALKKIYTIQHAMVEMKY
jgi:hypothetical protein